MTTPPSDVVGRGPNDAAAAMDMQKLSALALEAAKLAGEGLMARFGGVREVSTKRTPTDLVSDADRSAEATIVDLLADKRPLDGVIAEEGARRRSESGVSWVIDPLDGTANYLYGDHEWAVSVAAVDDQGPVVAVILAPASGRLFTAMRGAGAFEGSKQLACSSERSLDRALLLAGLDYDSATRARQMEMFAELTPRVRDLRRHGSAALELCRVAEGSGDAYLESPIQWWDIAAGALVASEAGAVVAIDVLAGPTRSVYACTPGIDVELRAWLAAHAAAQGFDFLQTGNHDRSPAEGPVA